LIAKSGLREGAFEESGRWADCALGKSGGPSVRSFLLRQLRFRCSGQWWRARGSLGPYSAVFSRRIRWGERERRRRKSAIAMPSRLAATASLFRYGMLSNSPDFRCPGRCQARHFGTGVVSRKRSLSHPSLGVLALVCKLATVHSREARCSVGEVLGVGQAEMNG